MNHNRQPIAPTITAQVFPSGGVILLNITLDPCLDKNTTPMTLERSINGGANQLLYNGVVQPIWIDDGDFLPSYLDFSSTYNYTVTDVNNLTASTGPITPSSQVILVEQYFDKLLFRIFSAGINALAVPNNYRKIQVLQEMPLNWGSTKLPIIVMNLDLEQQQETQIGESIDSSETNFWEIPAVLFRRYSITVMTENARERDFYRNAMRYIFYSMFQPLSQLGYGLEYSFQCAQNQLQETQEQPGFYEAVFMLDFTGTFNVQVVTNYSTIEGFYPDINVIPAKITGTYNGFGGWQIKVTLR